MHNVIFRDSSESGEEVEIPSSVLDLVEFLLAFCLSSNVCEVESPILGVCTERSDPRRLAKHVSSVADRQGITNSALKRYLVKPESETEVVNRIDTC